MFGSIFSMSGLLRRRQRRVMQQRTTKQTRLSMEPLEDRTTPSISFAPTANYGVGTSTHPYAVATGDFNGDGRLDLVSANHDSNDVRILLGNGDGTLTTAGSYDVGFPFSSPESVAVGDFDGDGRLDLVTANYTSASVSILRGNGDGTFGTGVRYAVGAGPNGSGPNSVAVGDLNGDGKLDLAVAKVLDPNVAVLINNGDGTFAAAVNYGTQGAAQSVTIGDFNRDGRLDLAVADGAGVSTREGNGDGTFGAESFYGVGYSTLSVTAGDFDRDGVLDLAAVGFNGSINRASILSGAGDGSFAVVGNYDLGFFPRSVTAADLNADGKLDLAVVGGIGQVSVLAGVGDGTFAADGTYSVGSNPPSVAAGDFNGDGKLDLVTANYFSNDVGVLLNTTVLPTSGTFPGRYNYTAGNTPHSVATGDFNRDGRLDLAVANQGGTTVTVMLGNSDGTFSAAGTFDAGIGPTSVVAADFNGDGKLDLATANSNGGDASVLLGNGDGTFGGAVHYTTGSFPDSVAAGDFNGDGKLDLAVVNSGGLLGSTGAVTIMLGNGDGTFDAPIDYGIGSGASSVTTGDFDRDGKLDLAVTIGGVGGVRILHGVGDGTFVIALDSYLVGLDPQSVTAADFNGDGRLDLATANYSSNDVSILLGNGDGTFGAAANYLAGSFPASVAAGDFNGDGKLDLAVANRGDFMGTGTVSILFGNGDGTFGAAANYSTSSAAISVTVGDFNRDGKPDLAVANANPMFSTVNVLLNYAPLVVTTPNISISGATGTGGIYKISDTIKAVWNNTVLGDNNASVAGVTFDLSQFGGPAAVAATNSGGVWTASYSITSGTIQASNRNVAVTVTDTWGQSTTTLDDANATVDNVAPTVLVTSDVPFLGVGQTATITFTFSEPVNFPSSSVITSGGTITNPVATGPQTYTATFTPSDGFQGTASVVVLSGSFYTDLAGNAGSGDSVNILVDTLIPVAGLTYGGSDPTNVSPIIMTATFTEPVSDLAAAGVGATNATVSSVTRLTPDSFSIDLSPLGDGLVTAFVLPDAVTDFAGNLSLPSLPRSVTYDTTAPSVGIASSATTLKAGETATITFTFSEPPVGFTAAGITATGGTITAPAASPADPKVYTATFTPAPDFQGPGSVTVAAGSYKDAVGNLGLDGSVTFSVDTVIPPVTPPAPNVAPTVALTSPPSVSVAIGPLGEVVSVVTPAGVLNVYDAAGPHVMGSGVRAASIAFEPLGVVMMVTTETGALIRLDAAGVHVLGWSGVQDAGVAFLYGPQNSQLRLPAAPSEVVIVLFSDGSLWQFGDFGTFPTGMVL